VTPVARKLTAFAAVLLALYAAGFAAGRVTQLQPPAEDAAPHGAMAREGR